MLSKFGGPYTTVDPVGIKTRGYRAESRPFELVRTHINK